MSVAHVGSATLTVLLIFVALMLLVAAYGVALEFVHGFGGYKDDLYSGKTLRSLRFGIPYAVFRRDGPVPVPESSRTVEVTELGGRYVLRDPVVPFSDARPFVSAVLSRDRRRLTAWVGVRTLFELVAVGALVTLLVLMVVEGVTETGAVPWSEGALSVFFAWGLYVLGGDVVRLPRKFAAHAGFFGRERAGGRQSPRPGAAAGRRGPPPVVPPPEPYGLMGTGLLFVFFAVAVLAWVKLEPHVPARHDGSRWSLRLGLPVMWYGVRAPVPVPEGDGVIEVVEADGRYVVGERREPWDAKPLTRQVGRGKTGTLALLSRDRRHLTVWAGPYASLFLVLIPLFVVPQLVLARGRYAASLDDLVATACSALLVLFWLGMWWSLVQRARRYASYVGFIGWIWTDEE